ncbi:1-deoxy-D-xylulose-5-phosphate synthase [Parvimonas sp. G1425]|uniref:1-deoxy-D-xylulose-5-phosphate synthase n=1 Tax=Parvimonas sp. G1425 TaxID=3387694 RepID=UPI0039E4FB01
MYLEKINSPSDVKKLSIDELKELVVELRTYLLKRLSEKGGHIGPNLGSLEFTVALHYVFDSPKDKIVFDVSHQTYVHKMLTGRKDAFMIPEKYESVTGFTSPKESKHDLFTIGHTSTSISLACGLAKARDLKGDNENIIAVIGDGSLGGGEALEGLNNVFELKSNMIVVINDNDQSIAENHGGLYKNLYDLRKTKGKAEDNLFKAMGLDYIYVDDGNDIEELISAFKSVKDLKNPIVVHISTTKGKGFKPAEINREKFHYGAPFDIETGDFKNFGNGQNVENYKNLTVDYLLNAIKKDKTVAVLNAGTPGAFRFSKEIREKMGKQYIDVGIAEEHAVAMSSGLAKNGAKPVFCVYSTFMQRTYDQISHDLCLNNNPALMLVYGASIYEESDATHLGFFDIPMISNIPNLVYLAPTNKEEYFKMLDWGLNQIEHPVAIRVPVVDVVSTGEADKTDYSILNKSKVTKKGKDVAIIALSNFYNLGKEIADELGDVTLINPVYITGLDEELLEELKESHKLVITLEDSVIEGGFGEKIARFFGTSDVKVKNYGIKKSFPDRFIVEEFLIENGISKDLIINDIKEILNK